MTELLRLTITDTGEVLIFPGPAFSDDDVDVMVSVVGAVYDTLKENLR